MKNAKSVMILMIKSVYNSWKQPLGYLFVSSTCKGYSLMSVIFNCISKLKNIGLNVRVMISDMGSSFKLLMM